MLEKKVNNPFYKIAWHPSLLCIMGATAIWGLFPMFFHYMDKFQEHFTLSYLVLRFFLTALIFVILFVCINKRALMLRFARRHYKTLIYGGVIMFLVRYTETRAFEQGYTTFATIFCVALVPLMEPPAMYLYRVLRPLGFIFGRQSYQRMQRITAQKSNYWLEYGLTSVTVLAAAMIYMYAQDGYILLDPQGENQNLLNAFVYVLLSAFGLTLYFHTLEYGFSSSEAGHALKDNEKTVCKQACFCLTALFCFILLSWGSEEQVVANISAKLTPGAYKFWIAMAGGIVLLGSAAAYFLANLGHDKYKTEKERLPFRIEAGEWLASQRFSTPCSQVF